MMLSLQDAIMRPGGPEIGILFPEGRPKFLVRQPSTAMRTPLALKTNEITLASLQGQVVNEDVLVRLPSLRASKWRVTVLQQWIGHVEQVNADVFIAVLSDSTNPKNPPEEVELDRTEISPGDLPLLAPGATFYWSIGYRDTPGGQRERVSTVRFARQPRLSESTVTRVLEQADRLAAFLGSD